MITTDQYNSHDCHRSEEDGCSTCDQWAEQNEHKKAMEEMDCWLAKEQLKKCNIKTLLQTQKKIFNFEEQLCQ